MPPKGSRITWFGSNSWELTTGWLKASSKGHKEIFRADQEWLRHQALGLVQSPDFIYLECFQQYLSTTHCSCSKASIVGPPFSSFTLSPKDSNPTYYMMFMAGTHKSTLLFLLYFPNYPLSPSSDINISIIISQSTHTKQIYSSLLNLFPPSISLPLMVSIPFFWSPRYKSLEQLWTLWWPLSLTFSGFMYLTEFFKDVHHNISHSTCISTIWSCHIVIK